LDQERTYLHAHPEQILTKKQLNIADKDFKKRLNRYPIAYITGNKEFYGRNFIVTPDTLIPRPESEDIITILKRIINDPDTTLNLIDVGTGSGCLGITAKLEFDNLKVTLTDISNKALAVAHNNASKLGASVKIAKSNLLEKYFEIPDIIVANLPYVDKSWDRSPETDYEPALALFASDNGLSIINRLILQSIKILPMNGYLVLEADPAQHEPIINFSKLNNLKLVDNLGYALAFQSMQTK
jgi:release factor glutamine methyltransferase